MSEPISEPVSPITESGDRSSVEWTGPGPDTQEEVCPTSQPCAPQTPRSDSDVSHEISIDFQSTSDTLKSSVSSPTEQLLPLQQYERQPLSIYDQLGRWNLIVTGVGSIYALIILGFLWFLWGGQEGIPFWKWLVVENYVQRTVTLLSAILRITMAAQSSLATSMLAAIIMETQGFTLKRSAFLSLWRSNAGHPFKLLEIRYFLRHAKVLSSLIILLSFTTMAAYFTSTALIADFEVASIPGYAVASHIPYSLNNMSLFGDEPVYGDYRPANFPVFAEYSEPANRSEPEVDDTGPTIRAILPISSATVRENLNYYSGYGTLLNSHVICVKPVIQNLTFESREEAGTSDGFIKPLISGTISLDTIPSGIMFNPKVIDFFSQMPVDNERGSNQSVTFICQMAQSFLMVAGEWPISMCVAGNRLNNTNGFVDWGRLNILGTRATSLLNANILMDPLSYVMVNYSGVPPKSSNSINVKRIQGNNWTEIAGEWPTWRTFQGPSIFPDFKSVSISYCFSHFAAVDAPITANGSTPNFEPALTKSNASSTPLDARNVTRQLGADGVQRSLNDRGILTLQKSDSWAQYTCNWVGDPGIMTTTALDGTYGFGMQKNYFTPPVYERQDVGYYLDGFEGSPLSATWGLCTNCMVGTMDDNTLGIHFALSSIFQNSIKDSRSVATALQALFTVVNMMQYYDRLTQFDLASVAYFSLFEPAVQPRRRSGLAFFTTILLLHLFTVITITIIFHLRTKNSFVGQSWHAVAQLQNESAIPVLEKAGMMRDNEVEKWMEAEGIDGNERFFMNREMAVGGDEGSEKSPTLRQRIL